MLRYSEDRFNLLPIPVFARLALGGLIVGAISVAFPEVWGNGYSVTNQMLRGELALDFLMGVFFAKLLATLATVGSGAVGDVFTPTLFLGRPWGALLSRCCTRRGWLGDCRRARAPFALVGMGSVLAATTHSAATGDDHGF